MHPQTTLWGAIMCLLMRFPHFTLMKTMNLTLDKLFEVNLQKEDAKLMIHALSQKADSRSRQIAFDLNERYEWNYRESAI